MKRFLSFWREEQEEVFTPRLPKGVRIYAVGDVHGHDDLLRRLLDKLERDLSERPTARTILLFLGDLIDRGPASRDVVERLRTYRRDGVQTVFLMGNHEEILLRIIDGEDRLIFDWLSFGGDRCMESYGLSPKSLSGITLADAGRVIRGAIPEDHVGFLRTFSDSFRAGDYLFVHAGIRPGVPLAQQVPEDLRWIRTPFLDFSRRHDAMVVHGHTISIDIDERHNRIGIDTSAYQNGVLTAMGAEGSKRWFIQAKVGQG